MPQNITPTWIGFLGGHALLGSPDGAAPPFTLNGGPFTPALARGFVYARRARASCTPSGSQCS